MAQQAIPHGLKIVTITYTRGADGEGGPRTTVDDAVILKESISKTGDELVKFVKQGIFDLSGSTLNPQEMKTASTKFGPITMSEPHGYAIN